VNQEADSASVHDVNYITHVSFVKFLYCVYQIDRVEKEKQTIVVEIEALSSQLETSNKAKVSCFFVFDTINTLSTAVILLPRSQLHFKHLSTYNYVGPIEKTA